MSDQLKKARKARTRSIRRCIKKDIQAIRDLRNAFGSGFQSASELRLLSAIRKKRIDVQDWLAGVHDDKIVVSATKSAIRADEKAETLSKAYTGERGFVVHKKARQYMVENQLDLGFLGVNEDGQVCHGTTPLDKLFPEWDSSRSSLYKVFHNDVQAVA